MVFGDLEESAVNLIFIIVWGPATIVVSSPTVRRLTHFTEESSIGTPLETAETIRHSPSNAVAGAVLERTVRARGADACVAVCLRARPFVSVSKAKPVPGFVAKRTGRLLPRVAIHILSVPSLSS